MGLVYLMWRSFRQITIHKPVTSRPANSERYIVCQHKLEDTEEVHEYLLEVNKKLAPLMSVTNKDKDIVEIVPLSVIKGDEDFYNFIRESNNAFGRVQSLHLEKIRCVSLRRSQKKVSAGYAKRNNILKGYRPTDRHSKI